VRPVSRPEPQTDGPILPHPILNAMLVCDEATRDERTGKVTLRGIFEQIGAPGFPARHKSLSVYVKMIDAEGKYPLRFSIVHLETGTVVGVVEQEFVAKSRTGSVELTFNLHDLPFPKPGTYEFQLHVNQRYLGSKTVSVVLSSPRSGG